MSRARVRFEAGEVVEYELVNEDRLNRCWQAIVLSPDLQTCRALLRGEKVPADRLDREWAQRFWRRGR